MKKHFFHFIPFFGTVFFIFLTANAQNADFLNSPEWESALLPPPDVELFAPLKYQDSDVWQGSTYFGSHVEWARIGKNWLHPGEGVPVAVKFVAPRDGTVLLTGNVRKIHLDANTDGVRAAILVNKDEIWAVDVAGGDGIGETYRIELAVKKGNALRFMVFPRASHFCDSTGWDPVITYKDVSEDAAETPEFVASEYFTRFKDVPHADGRYGDGNPFYYEMYLGHNPGYSPNRAIPKVRLSSHQTETLKTALGEMLAAGLDVSLDVNLWILVLTEWVRDDRLDTPEIIAAAIKSHREKTEKLLADLHPARNEKSEKFYSLLAAGPEDDSLLTYMKLRILKREIALTNPLLGFGELLFVKRKPSSYSHITMQYNGWRAQAGGGMYVLENPGKSLKIRPILDEKFVGGSVLEPCLSYDGKTILFSWVDVDESRPRFPWEKYYPNTTNEKETVHDEYYHIYRVDVDGRNLRRITSDIYDDLFPCWLPDGDIAFCSTRRKGYSRCFWWGFGDRWHVYTLHRMKADGSGIQILSWHDTNEWFPTVGHDGQIFYARWDYIDRDAITHQNLWVTRPDGTNPAAVWGNAAPSPHATFQAKPVPDSRKWIFTASAHHSATGGCLVLLDPSVSADGQDALERITPEVLFPEAESGNIPTYYDSPWPLSENYFLAAYSPVTLRFEPREQMDNALGVYLVDRFGNRELLYRDATLGACNPIPLAARPVPPVLPSFLPENPRNSDGSLKDGTFFVTDIYQGLGSDVPRGFIRELRVVRIFPKETRDRNVPPMGLAGDENGRAILGTVPVEADGSVYFRAPAQTPLYFQALDADGMAYQTMRSLTYLQPGEEVGCVGCHEGRKNTGAAETYFRPEKTGALPLAGRREPSVPKPGAYGGRPFSYVEMIQPIWNKHCVSCHGENPRDEEFLKHKIDLTDRSLTREECREIPKMSGIPETDTFNISYFTLMRDKKFLPRAEMHNQIQMSEPGGGIGALGSGLIPLLRGGHAGVELTDEELAAVGMWIDMNAIFYGISAPEMQAEQRAGRPVPMQTLR